MLQKDGMLIFLISMSKYASLLFTTEKYETIGPFRFPVYGDLVPGEARKIEEIARQQSKSSYKSIKLAQRIAKDMKITVKEAIDLLGKLNEPENQEILLTYVDQLQELEMDNIGAITQQIQYVTVLMQHRAEAKLGGDWAALSDWTTEDTERMPQRLMSQVFDLMMRERDGVSAEGNDPSQAPASKPN
jgi:hypothetical protein